MKSSAVIGETITAEKLRDSILEEDYLTQILELAHLRGWLCYHTRDSRRSNAGFPDLVMVRDGRIIIAEVKRQRGRLDAQQEAWITGLMAVAIPSRLEVHVWRPSDFAEVEKVLR